MQRDRKQPFNDLPRLPPAHIELETKRTLKLAITANLALAELRAAGHLLPNQSVLIRLIGLQEAKLSSEIENIVTTNDDLYRAYADDSTGEDPRTKEVLSYNDALWYGYNRLRDGMPISTRLFEEVVQRIRQNEEGVRRGLGTVIASRSGGIIYAPPQGEAVIRQKLAELEQFLYSPDDIDPLIKMAALHYQFEAIHPFSDGNGRTGRILNILYLISAGLLDTPTLYLSRYIIDHKSAYYSGLRAVTEEGRWEDWILFMLRGVLITARETHQRITDILALMDRTAERVRQELPRIYSKELIDVLFAQPYCRIHTLEEAGIAQRQTASKYLQQLTGIGILHRIDVRRDRYFLNHDFLDLLTR